MCLAVPGKIIECRGSEALVDFQGNRLNVCMTLTPEAATGDWVLVHAGFALSTIAERDALETWEYLRAITDDPFWPAGEPGGGGERAGGES